MKLVPFLREVNTDKEIVIEPQMSRFVQQVNSLSNLKNGVITEESSVDVSKTVSSRVETMRHGKLEDLMYEDDFEPDENDEEWKPFDLGDDEDLVPNSKNFHNILKKMNVNPKTVTLNRIRSGEL